MSEHTAASSRFLSFDVETTGLIGDGPDLPELLCAAALILESDGSVCTSYDPVTWPKCPLDDASTPDDLPARVMNKTELLDLVDYMWTLCAHPKDMRVLAWNGVGYDLRLLYMHCIRVGTASGMIAADRVREMALASCDPMLNFAYRKGFPVKLSAAAKLLSLPMSKNGEGAECADIWLKGDRMGRIDVLRYCANDVAMTAAVFAEMQRTGSLKWQTRSGKSAEWRPPKGSGELFAPCSETMKWAFANNDFMRTDIHGIIDHTLSVPCPDGFVGWLNTPVDPLDVHTDCDGDTPTASVAKKIKIE
jgi:hypothetical protein